jgi:hypothetical protein
MEDKISSEAFLNMMAFLEENSWPRPLILQMRDWAIIQIFIAHAEVVEAWRSGFLRRALMWLRGWREKDIIDAEEWMDKMRPALKAAMRREAGLE